jgi:hypothetical protein
MTNLERSDNMKLLIVILILAIFLIAGCTQQTAVAPAQTVSNATSNNNSNISIIGTPIGIVTTNLTEEKCRQNAESIISIVNENVSPSSRISLIEIREFNNVRDSLDYIGVMETPEQPASTASAEDARNDIESTNNSINYIALLQLTSTTHSFSGEGIFFFLVCDSEGNLMLHTGNQFKLENLLNSLS